MGCLLGGVYEFVCFGCCLDTFYAVYLFLFNNFTWFYLHFIVCLVFFVCLLICYWILWLFMIVSLCLICVLCMLVLWLCVGFYCWQMLDSHVTIYVLIVLFGVLFLYFKLVVCINWMCLILMFNWLCFPLVILLVYLVVSALCLFCFVLILNCYFGSFI